MEQNRRSDVLLLNFRDGKDLLTDFTSVDCTRADILGCTHGNLQTQAVDKKHKEKMQSYFNQFDADKADFQPLVMSSSGRLEKGFVNFIREVTKLVSLNNTFGAGESRVHPSQFAWKWKARITVAWKKRNWLNARRLLGGILNEQIPNNSTRWEIQDTLLI